MGKGGRIGQRERDLPNKEGKKSYFSVETQQRKA